MKASKQTQYTIPCQLPEHTFIHETTSDNPTYLVFQLPQVEKTETVIERMEGFESSFIDLSTITAKKTNALIGYAITIKRGLVSNLGVALIIRKTRLDKESKGRVDLSMSGDMIKLGEVLRIIRFGDGAIFIGAVNDYPPFFY